MKMKLIKVQCSYLLSDLRDWKEARKLPFDIEKEEDKAEFDKYKEYWKMGEVLLAKAIQTYIINFQQLPSIGMKFCYQDFGEGIYTITNVIYDGSNHSVFVECT